MEVEYNNYLQEIDENPTNEFLFGKFENAYKNWKFHYNLEYRNTRQKAKISWLNDGDTCSKKFHAKMSLRRHVNNWGNVILASGQLLHDSDKIEEVALWFVSNIFFFDSP